MFIVKKLFNKKFKELDTDEKREYFLEINKSRKLSEKDKERIKAYRLKNKERVREWERRYYLEHKDEVCKKAREDYHKNKIALSGRPLSEKDIVNKGKKRLTYLGKRNERLEYFKRYRESNKDKFIIWRKCYSLIRSRKILREPCQICGIAKTNIHHPDYSQPHLCIHLCDTCHQQVHRGLLDISNLKTHDYSVQYYKRE